MNTVPTTAHTRYEEWALAVREHMETLTVSDEDRAAIIAAGVDIDSANAFDRFAYVELHRRRIGAPVDDLPARPEVPAWASTSDTWVGGAGEIVVVHKGEPYGAEDLAVHLQQTVEVMIFPELSRIPQAPVTISEPYITWRETVTNNQELKAAKALRFALALAAAANQLDALQS